MGLGFRQDDGNYSSPCAAGIGWVGWIVACGFASPTVVVDGDEATLACVEAGGLA